MEKRKIKICLYLEFYHFLGGKLFKKIGTGLLSSYKNQRVILTRANVEFVEKWDVSCDILQINTPWLYSLYLMKKAKRLNKKVIVWSHVTAEDFKQVFRFSGFLAPIFKKYLKYAYNSADVILSPSEYTKSLVVNYGISASKIKVMSNGVDTKQFVRDVTKREAVRKEWSLENLVVGNVALAIPRKGVATFINLSGMFPKNIFIWFGKIYSSVIVKAVPGKLPNRTVFTGFVPDIVGAFNALDVFFFPSYEENQGMVILEAGAVGLPVLVRDIPVYSGWLTDGHNCLKAKTDEEFKEKLSKLLSDSELRNRLAETFHKEVDEFHSMEALGREVVALYNSLTS